MRQPLTVGQLYGVPQGIEQRADLMIEITLVRYPTLSDAIFGSSIGCAVACNSGDSGTNDMEFYI
jgi:hypothetical protein